MQHEKRYITSFDGLKLFLQIWKPEGDPKGVVQIVHGLGEHSNRYYNVVNALISAGFVIYASDLRGHGNSEGSRMYVNKFENFIKDQKSITEIIQTECPNTPIFLFGHSLGSTIVILMQDYNSFGGLVLSASGMKPGGSVPTILIKLSSILAKIFPKLKASTSIKGEDLSRDPNVARAYMEDPLVYKSATIRLGDEFFKAVNKSHPLLEKIHIPCLVISGEYDSLMLGANELYDKLGSKEKSLKIIKGSRHEVFNEIEPSKSEALDFLIEFLTNHL